MARPSSREPGERGPVYGERGPGCGRRAVEPFGGRPGRGRQQAHERPGGVVNSQIQQGLGIEFAPKADVVNALLHASLNRADQRILNYWYDHSGEDFDWILEGLDYELMPTSAANRTADKALTLTPKLWPPLEGYDYREEVYPYFNGTMSIGHAAVVQNAVSRAEAAGAQVIYGLAGEQLIQDGSGAVTGAYAKDADGAYTRIDAKAVVIACGDFSGNDEMLAAWAPEAVGFRKIYTVRDADGNTADTGDGQRMGIWAGGSMELGPYAPMTHHMGRALGVDAFLQLNAKGERFMNEDVPGQNIQNQLSRQPGGFSWQVFDAKWPEELATQSTGHGYVNYYVPADQVDQYQTVLTPTPLGALKGYIDDELFQERVDLQADTLEDLVAQMGLPAEAALASIVRYNELAAAGEDADFGKPAKRLFPIDTPPFYAFQFRQCAMLVAMGGLRTNERTEVLGADDEPIPGLYVAGNSMGGRFLIEYPVNVAGISLGTALTFGRQVGRQAAAFVG